MIIKNNKQLKMYNHNSLKIKQKKIQNKNLNNNRINNNNQSNKKNNK